MDNAPNNESQEKQTERAADSPLKKPETETVKARPSDVAATPLAPFSAPGDVTKRRST